MGSDRARISYDPSRAWRSVVAQQGRVTLEADVNEASIIAQENLRAEIIDIVGPAGTPDDGYAVSGAGRGDISVGPGTLYLGGWRLALDQPLLASAQPDWLDAPAYVGAGGNEAVLLRATEQDVTAVEDQALREVALGGPDTAARSRLLQHVLRLPVTASDCADAAKAVAAQFAAQGLSIDPKTLQILSTARLKVGFVPPTPAPGPCDPPAQGGYLGADNQLIRVTVIAFDPLTGKGTLLWGYNNASFLYRGSTAAPDKIVLAADPIDAEHTPTVGSPIEVARTRTALDTGNYIAAPEGEVRTLTAPYAPDTRTISLPSALPTEYVGDPNGPLFIRLWQAEVAFTSGQPTLLDPSGLQITVSLDALPTLASRPFWTFAVRPSTPINVYPARYGQSPQPPEGQRQWLCELAVIGWEGQTFHLLDDCRLPFLPLTQQTNEDCCGVVVGPDDLTAGRNLQAIIDQAVASGPGKVTLRPGRYILDQPLNLGSKHRGLVLEGCQDGAVLQAAQGAEGLFAQGLVVMQHADELTLCNLRFELPLVGWKWPGGGDGFISIGVMAVHCAGLRIERCLFRYHSTQDAPLAAVGVYARSECWGLELRDNAFLREGKPEEDAGQRRVLIGYSLTPDSSNTRLWEHRIFKKASVPPDARLEDALITGNRFEGLTAAVLVMARMGDIRCVANRVRDCIGGLNFFSSDLGGTLELAKRIENGSDAQLAAAFNDSLDLWLLDVAVELGVLIPLPPPSPDAPPALLYHPASAEAAHLAGAELRRRAGAMFTTISSKAAKEAETPPVEAEVLKAPQKAVDEAVTAKEKRAAAAAVQAEKALAKARQTAFDHIYGIALQTRLLASAKSRPVLLIKDNDIEALGLLPAQGAQSRTKGKAAVREIEKAQGVKSERAELSPAMAGINVVLDYDQDDGSVMLQNNRVKMGSVSAPAAGVLLPTLAVATGNLFVQPTDAIHTRAVCFALVGAFSDLGRLDVMGNLVTGSAVISPPRYTSAPTTSWEFLNVIG